MKQWLVIASLAPMLLTHPLLAQDRFPTDRALETTVDYAQNVAQRPPEVEEEVRTIRLGAWLLEPSLAVGERYDTNIYATEDDDVDDWITSIRPRVKLESDWPVHDIEFLVGGDFGFYKDFSDENYEDYYLSNRNRFEIVRDTSLIAEVLYRHAHAPRSSPDSDGAAEEPITFDVLRGTVGFERSVGVVNLRGDFRAEDIVYADVDRIGGGEIDNSYRDRVVYDGGIRLGYQRDEDSELYTSARLIDTVYDDSTIGGRPDRDNTALSLTVGARKVLSDLWIFDVFAGYAPRDYVSAELDDISGGDAVVFAGRMLWNPTALTSVIGNLERKSLETTEPGASALINTRAALRVEHQLTRSLRLNGGLGYTLGDYAGIDREDDTYRLAFGAEYFFTKLLSVGADYTYGERDSTEAGRSFDKHVASLQLRVNY